ncbi:MAG: TIGR04282 family arsenosugar biosynthesis glycosyltransferase [Betaproteobacteria bacterium]
MRGATGELWCSPDADDPFLCAIADAHGLAMRVQPPADLGTRMRMALDSAMPERALLLGSDCPLLDAAMLVAASDALDHSRCVFIPAEDGGYALVGCHGSVPDCFAGIPWSTNAVMAHTRARLQSLGQRWTELPPVWDVDTVAELARLVGDVRLRHLLDGLGSRIAAGGLHPIEVNS